MVDRLPAGTRPSIALPGTHGPSAPPSRSPTAPKLPRLPRAPTRPAMPRIPGGIGRVGGALALAELALIGFGWLKIAIGYKPPAPDNISSPGWAKPSVMPDGASAEPGTFQATIFALSGYDIPSDNIYLHDRDDSAPFPSFQRRYWGRYPNGAPGTSPAVPVSPRWTPPELMPPDIPEQPYAPRQPARPDRGPGPDVQSGEVPRPTPVPGTSRAPVSPPGRSPRVRRRRRRVRSFDPIPVSPGETHRPAARPGSQPKEPRREVKVGSRLASAFNKAFDAKEIAENLNEIWEIANDPDLTWQEKQWEIAKVVLEELGEDIAVGFLRKNGKSLWTPSMELV